MVDITTLHRDSNNRFYVMNDGVKEELEELFSPEVWSGQEIFKLSGIKGYEPMTAKELETEEEQDAKMKDPSNYLEEKFDGTRALVYFFSQETENGGEVGYCRVFSRRISKKTGFYVENSDSVPQIREIDVPELAGTILDGEMFINGLPFKEVSSTLNCLWDKAIDRQLEKGFISLHAFDILFYKGVDLRNMSLEKRKKYLHLAVEEANSPYIEEVKYYECGISMRGATRNERDPEMKDLILHRFHDNKDKASKFINRILTVDKDTYEHLAKCIAGGSPPTPRAYYELIVATGGEGLIIKPKNGRYHHKRGWEYSKVKKFLTREMIVIGFDEPTKEYTGKDVSKWGFWVEDKTDKRITGNFYGRSGYTPVTKFYYYNQVGNLLLGVLISKDTYNSMPKNKQGEIFVPSDIGLSESLDSEYYLMEVCECAGFDDETREVFTQNKKNMVGSVVEVKANELFRDSGKMRHPRYLRVRNDKEPERCTWEDHIGDSEVTK